MSLGGRRRDRFPPLAAELIALDVDLSWARHGRGVGRKEGDEHDPGRHGIRRPGAGRDSLARPGGNITGFRLQPELETKRLELLKEMAPATSGVAALLNMSNPVTAPQLKALEAATRAKGWRFRLFDVRSREDIESAFAALDTASDAIVVGLEGVTQAHRKTIADLAAKHRLPAIYGGREFVEAGGLIFYGPSFTDIYRRAATYVDKILKGANPADLPVEQPTRFELVINARAAQALGLQIPANVSPARRRGDRMRRRALLRGLGNAPAVWSLSAWAQPAERVRRIGV